MNCWDDLKCGRERGGSKARELGVCPAYTMNAGDACWLVAGTFCKGKVQGTYAEKKSSCMGCPFYQKFDLNHRGKARERFAALMK